MPHINAELYHDGAWKPFWSCNVPIDLVPIVHEHAAMKERDNDTGHFYSIRITMMSEDAPGDDTYTDAEQLQGFLHSNW